MGTCRYVYNRTLNDIKTSEDIQISFQSLRNKHVTFEHGKKDDKRRNEVVNDWEQDTPKDIRASTVKTLATNFKSAFTNLKRGNIKYFNMSYRKKKQNQSMEIAKTAVKIFKNKISIYPKYISTPISIHVRECKKLYKKCEKEYDKSGNKKKFRNVKHDIKIQYFRDKWYIHVPIDKAIEVNKPTCGRCAIDPGVRKFVTIYNRNKITKIVPDKEKLKKLHIKLDRLKSYRTTGRMSDEKYQKLSHRVRNRLDNLIDELHYKTRNYLVNNYKSIILPPYESQEMVGKLNSRQVKRDMLQLKPYLFKCRLEESIINHRYYNITEEYTSITCTSCGNVKNKDSSETYNCQNCNLIIDRDVNGARNILIKYLITK